MQSCYTFPNENTLHEGTWLCWPHKYTYGAKYCNEIEPIWIAITKALFPCERVHIIAYNQMEQERITKLLIKSDVDVSKVDFLLAKTDDVWSRDTGPIFVYDKNKTITIVDFCFDGWGKKTPYQYDNNIPKTVAKIKNIPIVSIPDFVLEGGSVELDGSGSLIACKSSIISKNRNDGMTKNEAEDYLNKYLGATNFIWLEGVINEDITDAHIDGIARFYDDQTLLTVSRSDFLGMYENMKESDYDILVTACNAKGIPYQIILFPMTACNVKGLDYKGSYLNYYIANDVILLPIYQDVNDDIAVRILSKLYTEKRIVPIDVRPLYQYGGMLHCVTQQQPKHELF